jgi:thioredoxin-related protein
MRFLFILFLMISLESFAGDTAKLYNPAANVKKDVATAVAKAKKEGKNVLIQVGGNWCIWCYRYDGFVKGDTALHRITNENYVVYHLNYSKENKNLDDLKELGFPQRFGFPVFVVLNQKGERLHTQDSGLLEKEKSYDADKVKTFLKAWAPAALDPTNYKE